MKSDFSFSDTFFVFFLSVPLSPATTKKDSSGKGEAARLTRCQSGDGNTETTTREW